MLNKNLLYIFIILGLIKAYGQQTPVFADYRYNTLVINPSFSGFYEEAEAVLSGRTFLNGIEGSPSTISFAAHGPVNSKIGIGGMLIQDKIGVTSKTGVYGTYAFKLNLGYADYQSDWYYSPQSLSLGLIGGISYYKEDLLDLNISEDPNFQDNITATVPSFGIGVFYNNRNFYVGFSVPNLLDSSISGENNVEINSNYYLNAGYRFYTSRYLFIEPGVLFKYTNGAPWQVDINAVFNYLNKFEFGAGYRTTSTLNIFAGFYLSRNWRMIYNFNPSLGNSPLGKTHGIVLSYRFGKGFGSKFN
ncbi:PorP/SprF family type IX secretion system membrane protein [Abyssalbus ytuae]|uniref:PorP/SprF family type IX secretion system membrane protein n=1 Tax=Abyssalbus ytuae TaxID=2926907 RepID=A0A9E6ZMF4_9FLAO|nr:PorP/SprF family type IX secretion system membrane protein [Abyssalbus ytuae]UOB18512.1 PorP/SprF family type IX secretion system membrane protein [Abyssalbus ytuae]